MQRRPLIDALLWAWVVIAFLAYLYQFRDEAAAVLRLLGLDG